jgi:hypothetical protein
VILHCDYEELRALTSAIELMSSDARRGRPTAVTPPPESVARAEQLLPRLVGDVSIETLEDQRLVRGVVAGIVENLHLRLDAKVIEFHPGHEEAVALYFDYAHSRSVLHRLDEMGGEMTAIVELVTGGHPEAAAGITFPD